MFTGALVDILASHFLPSGAPCQGLPIMLNTTGPAIVTPSAKLPPDLFPGDRGIASSLQGVVQFCREFSISGVSAGTIGPLPTTTLKVLALGAAGFAVTSLALRLVCLRRPCTRTYHRTR